MLETEIVVNDQGKAETRLPKMFVDESNCLNRRLKPRNINKAMLKTGSYVYIFEMLAKELNPVISGVINYYCKFWSYHTQYLWQQLNTRLKKWVKWEKGLYKKASVKWLQTKYALRPNLFAHWKLVRS